jgi:tRNA dimethylallyltransferase
MKRIKVIAVVGPTASGKSDVAILLAKALNGEVISADSRQVYRSMDIGTGKVLRDKRRKTDFYSEGIRHHMLDVASPKRQYTVVQWKRAAQRALTAIAKRGNVPIVCGGTGLYIDTLMYDLKFPAVQPDKRLRSKLGGHTLEYLFAKLTALDPVRAATIDRSNNRRLIRALEIVLQTGKPVPHFLRSDSPYHVLWIGIIQPKEVLRSRIEQRLHARFAGGMINEVRRLQKSGVSWNKLESFGLEYRWIARYLRQACTLEEMKSALLRDSLQYAKRQMTWWHKNQAINWIPAAKADALARAFLKP